MIKINDILKLVNDGFKTHYFKDITSYGVCELIETEDTEGNTISRPAIYTGNGNYDFIQNDYNGLIIYHRLLDFNNDEDLESGFGRNSLTTETYSIKSVFIGQQAAIDNDCKDINLFLANEFKKLVPRRLNLGDTNRIIVTSIDYNKKDISEEEGIKYVPESVLFSLDLEIIIKSTENCNELTCN